MGKESPTVEGDPPAAALARANGRARLPFALALVAGFLAADAAMLAYRIFTGEPADATRTLLLDTARFQQIVAALFSVLLLFHIFIRSGAARIWGSAYFILQISFLVVKYVFRQPEEWDLLSSAGRMQEVMKGFCFTGALLLLNGQAARAYFIPRGAPARAKRRRKRGRRVAGDELDE